MCITVHLGQAELDKAPNQPRVACCRSYIISRSSVILMKIRYNRLSALELLLKLRFH
jgi:hypothetical protein